MATAFQSTAFQNNAYQIIVSQPLVLLGGGPGGTARRHEQILEAAHREYLALNDRIERAKEKQARDEAELKAAEQRDEVKKLTKKAVNDQQKYLASQQEEIRRLLIEQARLMQRIVDEEETLVVLYSLPFIH